MKVNGEMYLLVNGGMNLLSLLLAARLGERRPRWGRWTAAAGLGAVYALLAWQLTPWLRGLPAALGAGLLMTWLAFGRAGYRLFPLVAGAGLLFSGMAELLERKSGAPAPALAGCFGLAMAVCAAHGRMGGGGRKHYRIRIALQGREAWLPALRDSGNLLRDGVTGLPVIVAPEGLLRAILPPGVEAGNLASLPPGWRLLRIRTAAGESTVMCFRPDKVEIADGSRTRPVEAAVALSAFSESRALLPESMVGAFQFSPGRRYKEVSMYAGN